MKKPISYYESLPACMVDMNDPDIPESIKIRARNQMAQEKPQEGQANNSDRSPAGTGK